MNVTIPLCPVKTVPRVTITLDPLHAHVHQGGPEVFAIKVDKAIYCTY